MPSLTRPQKIIAWTPAILVSVFLILASALPKLFLSYEGSSLQAFATQLGLWEIIVAVGVLELVCAVLFLIPRTATVGFVLLVGLLGGAMATGLTHPEVTEVWPWFPGIFLALITLSAYYRLPELLDRIMGRPVPTNPLWLRIVGWVFAAPLILMNAFAAYTKFLTFAPESREALFAQAVGMSHIQPQLGVLEIIVTVLFLLPRTSTVGFILMTGYMGGVLAANLTHGFTGADVMPLYVLFVFLTVSAIGRNPELLWRLRGKLS